MQARLVCSRDQAWNDIRIPADMGMDCGHYKWYQNQSIVELAFPVPENVQPKEVRSSLMLCAKLKITVRRTEDSRRVHRVPSIFTCCEG